MIRQSVSHRGSVVGAVALIAGLASFMPTGAGAQTPATGRVAGRVVDKATGRSMASVRISVVGKAGVVESDLDGRFRTPLVEAGSYSVRAALIGFKPVQVDSIKVTAGQTTTISLALEVAPIQLEELTVASDAPTRISSSAGLLAAQQNAMAVVDGISAETISRTADSDAGQAVLRVTGLSVVENKVVVRGLSERYSNSQLNGVEIASPEPDKKFVSLDVFAASLIESIIAAKTATPDRPGDFAGGTVDIQTKEFPDNFIFSFGMSQGFNSRSTFKSFARTPRSGSDFLGFNGSGRGFPLVAPGQNLGERFSEALTNIWTPKSTKAGPDGGVDFAIGGRKDFGGDALGYIMSVNYGTSRGYNPDRYDAEGEAPTRFEESSERIELAGVGNLTYRLGGNQKFGFKNFYSRSSEEVVRVGVGGDNGDGTSLNYQVSYVQQYVTQSQLTGDHFFPGLGNSRVEWKGSYGQAERGDLDNRQLRYFDNGSGYVLTNRRPQFRGTNNLVDKSYSGQVDWSLPFGLRAPGDALLKVGGLYRRKNRDFDAISLELVAGPDLPVSYLSLPPEELLAPENLGPGRLSYTSLPILTPYVGTDRVSAGYAMADFELLPAVRIVGGARVEKWYAQLIEGAGAGIGAERIQTDVLWSTNLTYSMSATTNLRAAAYRTVARPDLRELSTGGYPAVVGGPPVIGNPDLKAAGILNADLRFEVYPAAEELFAVSLFAKRFTDPIVTTYRDAGGVVIKPDNGTKATSLGAEFEFRKRLGFLSSRLQPFLANGNVTLIRSRVTMPAFLGIYADDLEFQGQSPYLVNLGLTYTPGKPDLSVSVLFNRFGERIVRYPAASGAGLAAGANIVERPRSALDAKVKLGFWNKLSVSLSGKNLLNSRRDLTFDRVLNDEPSVRILGRSLTGMSFSMGLSYAY